MLFELHLIQLNYFISKMFFYYLYCKIIQETKKNDSYMKEIDYSRSSTNL